MHSRTDFYMYSAGDRVQGTERRGQATRFCRITKLHFSHNFARQNRGACTRNVEKKPDRVSPGTPFFQKVKNKVSPIMSRNGDTLFLP